MFRGCFAFLGLPGMLLSMYCWYRAELTSDLLKEVFSCVRLSLMYETHRQLFAA